MNGILTDFQVCTIPRVWKPDNSDTQYVDVQLIPGVKLRLASSTVDFSNLVNNGHERYWRLRLQLEPYFTKNGELSFRVLNADKPIELAGGFAPIDKQTAALPAAPK